MIAKFNIIGNKVVKLSMVIFNNKYNNIMS